MFKVTEADQQNQEESEKSQLMGFPSHLGKCRPKFLQILSPMGWQKEKENGELLNCLTHFIYYS